MAKNSHGSSPAVGRRAPSALAVQFLPNYREDTLKRSFDVRRGMILWIVMAILMAVAILAFALSRFKSGGIHLLKRTVEQSRMMVYAKSALHEATLKIRFNANRPGDVATRLRSVFVATPSGSRSPALPFCDPAAMTIFQSDDLPNTTALIAKDGLRFEPHCQVRVIYNREVNAYGASAFRGFLELASDISDDGISRFKLLERRELVAVDMSDYFDKYALFVKYFPGWDLNRVDRRMTVFPAKPDWSNGAYSREYFGKEGHPTCEPGDFEKQDPDHGIYLDLSFNNGDKVGGGNGKGYAVDLVKQLTPGASPVNITPISASAQSQNFQTKAFHYRVVPWSTFAGGSKEIFDFLGVKRHYLIAIVQPAIKNDPNDSTYSNYSAAHMFTQDFKNRSPKYSVDEMLADDNKLRETNFSACKGFQMMVNSYEKKWQYHYAYVTADAIWNLDEWESGNPNLQTWRPFADSTETRDYYGGICQYLSWDGIVGGKDRCKLQVGRMQELWGPQADLPALIEGDVYLRFFKVGFFDEFTDTINLWNADIQLRAKATTLPFAKPASTIPGEDFLCKARAPAMDEVGLAVSGTGYRLENVLMCRAVDNIPFNRLLNGYSSTVSGAGAPNQEITPATSDTIVKPTSKSGASAKDMYPIISPSAFSRIYEDGETFLAAHRGKDPQTIHLDGKTLIRKGPLDLKGIRRYTGVGLIKVNVGDILLGSLEASRDTGVPSKLKLYAQYGHIVISEPNPVIEASLLATSFAPGPPPEGRGIGQVDFGNANLVKIYGNLVVDHLNLSSLAVGGKLEIYHPQEFLQIPSALKYRISISRAKSQFALDSDQDQTK